MLQKVRGIVLNSINYNDKYMLTHIYTDSLGRVTYLIPKTGSKTSKVKKALFFPLAILEIEAEHRALREIQRIKEAHAILPLHSIATDLGKTSVAFFLSEFLMKTLRDVNENNSLFQYLSHSVEILEYTNKSIANFHLVFILQLTRFLGFYPDLKSYKSGDYFDMINGVFVGRQPTHRYFVASPESQALVQLSRINYENMTLFKFSRQDRVAIINRFVEYYRLHLYSFTDLRSLNVLHELF